MLSNKDYCDKETAFALQELGYYPYMFYDDGTPAIHLWYAQKWLREEKNIVVRIIPLYEEGKAIKGMSYTNEVIHWDDGYVAEECTEEYDSYEESLSEGIKEAIKHIEII